MTYELPRTPLLDHGLVRYIDHMGDDLSIVRAARVSYNAAWRTGENEQNDLKLLRRLWSGGKPTLTELPKHSTPFEAVVVTFEVKAPIFVFRQWHRHRTQAYNELSLRYKEVPDDQFYAPKLEVIGGADPSNKQSRVFGDLPNPDRYTASMLYSFQCHSAFATYHQLLEAGWPRELARCVLPLSTYSHMFATASLLNWLRFLSLRCDPHAQYEIRIYADAIAAFLSSVVPETMKLWRESVDLVTSTDQ